MVYSRWCLVAVSGNSFGRTENTHDSQKTRLHTEQICADLSRGKWHLVHRTQHDCGRRRAKVGAGFVSLSYAFPLVLTYAFAVLIGLERLQVLRAVGVLFGLAGGLLLALSGTQLSAEASLWSVFALSIPVFLAVGNIYRTLKWPEGARPVDLALGMMGTGFVALAVFTTAFGIPVVPVSWTTGGTALLAGQVAIFALQYGLYFRLQQTAGPVYLSQIGSVAAVIGLGLGFVVFGEVPNLAKLAAVAAVGLGIVFVTLGKGRA